MFDTRTTVEICERDNWTFNDIERLRHAAGLDEQQFANESGVGHGTIYNHIKRGYELTPSGYVKPRTAGKLNHMVQRVLRGDFATVAALAPVTQELPSSAPQKNGTHVVVPVEAPAPAASVPTQVQRSVLDSLDVETLRQLYTERLQQALKTPAFIRHQIDTNGSGRFIARKSMHICPKCNYTDEQEFVFKTPEEGKQAFEQVEEFLNSQHT
jgi:hypothetical protein